MFTTFAEKKQTFFTIKTAFSKSQKSHFAFGHKMQFFLLFAGAHHSCYLSK